MTKSIAQTNAEILASAKVGDVIMPESQSVINIRHTRSVHPVTCKCSLHRQTRFRDWNSQEEDEIKDELEWSHEPE